VTTYYISLNVNIIHFIIDCLILLVFHAGIIASKEDSAINFAGVMFFYQNKLGVQKQVFARIQVV